MNAKSYQVREVARMAGVTVRTLHHYDEIGLLPPSGRTEAGYRLYSDADLSRLHQILIARALGMPLALIGNMLDDPAFDRKTALLQQRDELKKRMRETGGMLRSVDTALALLEGNTTMETKQIFEGFDPAEYEQEARERWGSTDSYAISARRMSGYTRQDKAAMQAEANAIMSAMATAMQAGDEAGSATAMDIAERHRLHIDRWYYPCSHARHTALSEMYLADPRFKKNFEKAAEGLAEFFAAAIQANQARQ